MPVPPVAPNRPSRPVKLKRDRKRTPPSTRWCIRPEELTVLEDVFAKERSPTFAVRDALAEMFGCTTRQVSVWFRNRRQRSKDSESDHEEEGEAGEAGAEAVGDKLAKKTKSKFASL